MKAMIFAAGKGTRLYPMTQIQPKALVPFRGIPLLESLIRKCIQYRITELVINIHHHGEQIIDFLERNKYFGINIQISDERDKLLDTGGGLKKAAPLLRGDEPILIHNVDIVSDLNFDDLLRLHQQDGSIATLAVMNRESNRRFLVNDRHLLCGWENAATGERKMSVDTPDILIPAAYCGISIIESKFFSLMQREEVFSLTDTFLQVAKTHSVRTVFFPNIRWADVGSVEKLKAAEQLFDQHP